MDLATLIDLLDSTLRLSTPLLLACLAGLFSERAGVLDIGLEGKMLAAAFAAGAVAAITLNPWAGMLAGIGASVALALLHGVAAITFRGNQLISGVAINFLAAGLTVLLGQYWFEMGGQTPSLLQGGRFPEMTLPGTALIAQIPGIGPIWEGVVSGHRVPVYLAFALVPLTAWVLYSTRFGLRLRAVGENPAAVDTAGVSVTGLRFVAVLICGVLCGLAGAYLATGLSGGFVKDMTAGRGYIALAALIFAKWRPWGALGATLLFGLLEAVANRWQKIDLIWFTLPVQVMQALPYVLTVIILAGFIGRAVAPRAGGIPYVKER